MIQYHKRLSLQKEKTRSKKNHSRRESPRLEESRWWKAVKVRVSPCKADAGTTTLIYQGQISLQTFVKQLSRSIQKIR